MVHSRHRTAGELPLVTKHVANALRSRVLTLRDDAGQTGGSAITRPLEVRAQAKATEAQAVVRVDVHQHPGPQGPLWGRHGLWANCAFGATVITFSFKLITRTMYCFKLKNLLKSIK